MDRQSWQTKLRDFSHNPIFWLIASLAFILVILAIFLIYTISQPRHPEVIISNVTELIPDLPSDNRQGIQRAIYSLIEESLGPESTISVSQLDAIIREDSLHTSYDASESVHYGDFYLDIPAVEQDYKVSYRWFEQADDDISAGENIKIICPDMALNIYPNFHCNMTMYDAYPTTPENRITDYTPAYEYTEDGDMVYISVSYYANGTQYLRASMNSCGDQTTIAAGRQLVDQWLQYLEIPTDYFNVEFQDLCPGAF